MLRVWGDADIQNKFDGVVRNRHIYEKIAESMKKLGYDRTWTPNMYILIVTRTCPSNHLQFIHHHLHHNIIIHIHNTKSNIIYTCMGVHKFYYMMSTH